MRRRILHVTAGIDPRAGGVSQAVTSMIKGLLREGIDNEVVCLDDPNAGYIGSDFPIHALGPAKGPWAYSSKLMPWLNENLARYQTVIVHGMWLYHAYATRMAARTRSSILDTNGKKFQMLLMPHGMLDPYFQKAPGRKLKAIRNYFYWKFLENKMVNDADGLLFTCDEELRLAHQSFEPFAPKKEMVVGLGVEQPPAFVPSMSKAFFQLCPEVKEKPYILFLSRIHEKKGVDHLIKAYQSILEKETCEIPKLIIAGPGLDDGYGQSLKQKVEADEILRNNVFFPGMLTGDAKWGAFYNCETFVLPSHQENFGIAVVESLACGKPVLISNQVNIWKEIEQFGAGITDDDTFSGTRSLLEKWVHYHPGQKIFMAANALHLYKNKFSVDQFAKQLASLLQ